MCEWKMRGRSVNQLGLIRKKRFERSVKWVQNTVAVQRNDNNDQDLEILAQRIACCGATLPGTRPYWSDAS